MKFIRFTMMLLLCWPDDSFDARRVTLHIYNHFICSVMGLLLNWRFLYFRRLVWERGSDTSVFFNWRVWKWDANKKKHRKMKANGEDQKRLCVWLCYGKLVWCHKHTHTAHTHKHTHGRSCPRHENSPQRCLAHSTLNILCFAFAASLHSKLVYQYVAQQEEEAAANDPQHNDDYCCHS